MNRRLAVRGVSAILSRRATPSPLARLFAPGPSFQGLVALQGQVWDGVESFCVSVGKRVCGRVACLDGWFGCRASVGVLRRVLGGFSWLVGVCVLGERVLVVRVFGVYFGGGL